MKRLLYLITIQLVILFVGAFLQQKGFISLKQFYAYTIAPVGAITALVLRDVYQLKEM